jgi:hypothetical protein
MAAAEKISHLLELADQGPSLRTALAEEVADLLSAWPADYPESMRQVCESLWPRPSATLIRPPAQGCGFSSYAQPGLVQRMLAARSWLASPDRSAPLGAQPGRAAGPQPWCG